MQPSFQDDNSTAYALTGWNGCDVPMHPLDESCPIGRLPPELLSHIMVLFARDWYERHKNEPRSPRWIWLSHVSRHWRAVALSTKSFWANIVFTTRMDAFTTFLSRSRQIPLYLSMPLHDMSHRISEETKLEGLNLAAQVAPRLEELRLEASRQLIRAFCDGVLSSPDLLRTLVLEAEDDDESENDDEDQWEPLFPHVQTAPRHLRHLELRDLLVRWSDPVYRSPLTTLAVDLEYMSEGIDDQPSRLMGTFEQMWTVLTSLAPTLEALTLKQCIPSATGIQGSTFLVERGLLSFPRLRSICVGGDVVECTALLERMSCPPSTELCFDPCTAILNAQFNILMPSLARLYPRGFEEMYVETSSQAKSCLMLDAYAHHTTGPHEWSHSELKMLADIDTDDDPFTALVRGAPALFSNVRTLIAPGVLFDKSSDWEWFFQNVPDLRDLVLCFGDDPMRDVCAALGAVRPSADGESRPLLPRLMTFRLCEIDSERDLLPLDDVDEMSAEETGGGARTRSASELIDALRVRAEHGMPLTKVGFIGMRVSEEDVARTREVVQDVECEEKRPKYDSIRYMLSAAVATRSDGDD